MQATVKNIRATLKFIMFAALCLCLLPIQMILMIVVKNEGAYIIPWLWHKIVCIIFGIKIKTRGQISTESQTIFVSNHLSYLDIPVIGSLIRASFVAKKDVASWPVFGFLSKLQQTAFISRSREDVKKEKNALDDMVQSGKSLIIFPEGTSTDGRLVLPFKSSMFSIAMHENNKNLYVQPFTISLKSVNKRPATTQQSIDLYSWHRDMTTTLAEHLWRFAQTTGAQINIDFHPAIKAVGHENRKTLAKACYDTVSNGLIKTQTKEK